MVILIALLANAWMLALEFQFCDYEEIPGMGWMIGAAPVPMTPPGRSRSAPGSIPWRPVLWVVLHGLLRLSGEPAQAWIFHGFLLLAHALASFLLYLILSARVGRLPGMTGGALFAILPGGIQAVSWITAGADQLVVLFMLVAGVASDHALRRRSVLGVVACGLATFCAVSAKETAVVLGPALAMLWLIPPAGGAASRGRRIGLALSALAGAAVAWTLRALALGAWLPEYWTGARPALSQLGMLPIALRGFLVPWSPASLPGASAPVSASLLRGFGPGDDAVEKACILAGVLALLAPLAIGFWFSSKRGRLTMVALSGLLVLVVLPVLPLTTATGLGMSRAYYPASVMLASLVCAAVPGLVVRGQWLLAALIPFALFSADLLALVARQEVGMASAIRVARADLDRFAGSNSDVRLVLLQPPQLIGNVPFVGGGLADAACPPFGTAESRPLVWPGAATLKRCPEIIRGSSPAQVLEWNGDRVVARGPLLARIPAEVPVLEQDHAVAFSFRPRSAMPPRGVSGIRIDLGAGSRAAGGVVTFVAGGQTREARCAAPAGGGSLIVSVPDDAFDEPWFREPTLDLVRVQGLDVARPPVLLRALPAIVVERLEAGQLSLGAIPRLSFSSDAPAAVFRVTIECQVEAVRIPLSWSMSSSAGVNGRYDLVADGKADVSIGGRVAERLLWSEIGSRLAPYAKGRRWLLPAELRVEGLDPSGNVIARSEWLPLAIVR